MSVATGDRSVSAARAVSQPHPPGRLFTYKRQLFLLTLPYLVGLVGLVLVPFLLSIPFAFTDYDALTAPKWVGLDNFSDMFDDSKFWSGIWASAFVIALAVPLRVFGAVMLAFLLHKPRRSHRFHRVAVYLPTIVPDVAYALLWLYIFNPLYGPLNWILPLFGAPADGWLLVWWPAKFAAVLMMIWTIGEGFILMLASFQDIPGELHESAAVDGASGFQRFTKITLPILAPTILLLTFRDIVLSFQFSFVPALITFGDGLGNGGKPYYANQFLPFYIWQTVTQDQDFGYAAAMTWVMYGLTTIIILLTFIVAKRIRNAHYE